MLFLFLKKIDIMIKKEKGKLVFMEKTIRERNYGIDLLRIVAMMMVVLLHVINQGGVLNATSENFVNHSIAAFFVAAAYGAVNCYALVSGYVGMSSKTKYANILQLFLQVIFYTLTITTVFYYLRPGTVEKKDIISAFLPVSNESYWYFTAYFGMFFFSPFFNKMLNCLTKKEAKTLVVTIVLILSVFPCIFMKDVFKSEWGYSVIWLSALYILGGCIKIIEPERKIKKLPAFLIFVVSVSITFASTYLSGINKYTFLLTYTSPTVLISALALLVLFSQMNIKKRSKKVIGFLSPLAFGVYLIHTEPYVWNNILVGSFGQLGNYTPAKLVISIFAAVFAIWFVCSLIDYLRLLIFKLLHIKNLCVFIENKLLKKLF